MVIWSGGQTGVDRAAWDAAISSGLEQDGFVPKGRLAEDGRIPDRYRCRETVSQDYGVRTERNLRHADATLIICFGAPTGGTAATIGLCMKFRRPHVVIDLDRQNSADALSAARSLLRETNPETFNVAGPRESVKPGGYGRAYAFLSELFSGYRPSS